MAHCRLATRAILPRRARQTITGVAQRRLCSILLSLAATSGPLAATAQMGPQWWALDSSPPGTPPSVVLQPGSDWQQSVLEITIHGFYYDTIEQMGQTFRRLSLDRTYDEALYREVGRPELPALHHTLGALVGNAVGTPGVQVIEEVTVPGVLIYPAQPPLLDQPGSPPPFEWDEAFYQQMTQAYPADLGTARGYLGRLCGLNLVAVETYPFRIVPASQVLVIARQYHVTIPHPGTGTPVTEHVSRRQDRQSAMMLANYATVASYRSPFTVHYIGYYLIITAPDYVDEVERLAEQKRRRGYAVAVVTTDATGTTDDDIRTYIQTWWSAAPSGDHYVLLVGDTDDIPTTLYGDRFYGDMDGDEFDPDPFTEVRIGRFACGGTSGSGEAQCRDMVAKTLTYENGTPYWVGDVLLVSHKQDWPWYFTDAQRLVAEGTYATNPVFHTVYGIGCEDEDDDCDVGHPPPPSNEDVRAEIEAGRGVVCYRGLGERWGWPWWTCDFCGLLPDGHGGWTCVCGGDPVDFDTYGELLFLHNGIKTPVVFAIAPQNNAIEHFGFCAGESWMQTTERAVAHYGSYGHVSMTYNEAYDDLDKDLFDAIYDDGQVILGETMITAESAVIEEFPLMGETLVWTFELLGDPELKIWREPPAIPPISGFPEEVPPEPGMIQVQVGGSGSKVDAPSTAPVQFAIVSLHKPGEFAENRYTDAQGNAEVPINPVTSGTIYITVHTEFDSRAVAQDSIRVVDPTDASRAAARVLRLESGRPNPFRGRTAITYTLPRQGPVRLTIFDPQGRIVTTLIERIETAGPHVAWWDGRDNHGGRSAIGAYFARLQFGDEERCIKLTLVR